MEFTSQKQVILRRMDDSAVSVPEAVKQLNRTRGVAILDQQPSNLLVEGESTAIDRVTQNLQGWTAFPRKKLPIPTTRPRVLNPPSDE